MNDLMEPIRKHPRISEEVLERIKGFLHQKNLKPGDRLPTQQELARQFNVGRSSIREAVQTLSNLGFLDIRQGHGIYVKKPKIASYIQDIQESIKLFLGMERDTFFELWEIRGILEVPATSKAARNANEKDLSLLKEAFRKLEDNLNNPVAYIEADLDFHQAIVQGAHHTTLNFLLSLVYGHLRGLYLNLSRDFDFQIVTHSDHKRIYEAVKNHSEKEALSAIKSHHQHGEKQVASLKKMPTFLNFELLMPKRGER